MLGATAERVERERRGEGREAVEGEEELEEARRLVSKSETLRGRLVKASLGDEAGAREGEYSVGEDVEEGKAIWEGRGRERRVGVGRQRTKEPPPALHLP